MTAASSAQSARLAIVEWFPALLGMIILFVPTYVDLARSIWASEDQGQGPIILGVALFFAWKKRHEIAGLVPDSARTGWPLLIFGLLLYILGRSQDILIFEVGTQIVISAALLLIIRGWRSLGIMWFPLLFLIFMLPLPGSVVETLTLPMKIGVSWATEHILYSLGYPISRDGVILQIGQYKLLVADACAGLHTMFTLEALGLLYLHVMRHESVFRNTFLAIMIIPISFSANTTRVVALTLITYHLGDAAGQGFLHGFAGMVLFISALLLIMGIDSILQYVEKYRLSSGKKSGFEAKL